MNKIKNQMTAEKQGILRGALIEKLDTALCADEPDMDIVDLCNELLDALEHGSSQPGTTRMQRALADLEKEIDYIPRVEMTDLSKPLHVRRIVVSVMAVCLCLLILPISVMLLRGGSHGMAAESTGVTETAGVTEAISANEDAAVVFDGVMFVNGDRMVPYDDLTSCMDAELPELYYPTVFPETMQPTSVTVTGENEERCVMIGFDDARYSISILPRTAVEMPSETNQIRVWVDDISLAQYSSFGEEWGAEYRLSVILGIDDKVFEFCAPDQDAVYTMLSSMRRADADHPHGSYHEMIPQQLENGEVVYKVALRCSVCEMRAEHEEREHAEQGE